MRLTTILATAASAALLASPAGAAKPTNPGAGHGKAYGRYCAGQSKKHVAGQKGTPFSQCVNAMAKLASGDAKSARAACKGLSKKHVAGQKGTPFSRCIVAAAQLRHDAKADDDQGKTPDDQAKPDDTPGADDTGTATGSTGSAPTS
jgi:opacity protein-like surface antigen